MNASDSTAAATPRRNSLDERQRMLRSKMEESLSALGGKSFTEFCDRVSLLKEASARRSMEFPSDASPTASSTLDVTAATAATSPTTLRSWTFLRSWTQRAFDTLVIQPHPSEESEATPHPGILSARAPPASMKRSGSESNVKRVTFAAATTSGTSRKLGASGVSLNRDDVAEHHHGRGRGRCPVGVVGPIDIKDADVTGGSSRNPG
eukprot:CAMPEP_0180149314 /NCGR_PEP_ID=MMETSP0986-20121125/20709_1 /TAXON_ID=697907 /ORGANISM="non described non described, Strain CCMP2293" /LENGTH=206 /DNA_ID=CAMNT_0022095893 /DNA_START=63 /DNA_END=684 /DNA_ORIENTATION=-